MLVPQRIEYTEPYTQAGRTIALFPGAFRPPHAAHMRAVEALLERSDLDEVVIVISSRNRPIPGTSKVMDADVAACIWQIYLAGLEATTISNVRIEIANHAAIQHALSYFERVTTADRLLFCLGEADLEWGDERFDLIESLAQRSGINAQVIAAPTGDFSIRATDLRTALSNKECGRQRFTKALPAHLTQAQRQAVWQKSYAGMKEQADAVVGRVRTVLMDANMGDIHRLEAVASSKVDPVFRVAFGDQHIGYAKYAGDTVGEGTIGNPFAPKPRQRLATERRVLRRLRQYGLDEEIVLPDVLHFDKETRTLLLSEVCLNGRSLETDLQQGIFDENVAKSIGRFLARCHNVGETMKPVWGDWAIDAAHWERMLDYRTVDSNPDILCPTQWVDVQENLVKLKAWSQQTRQRAFFHLDLAAKNVRMANNCVGVIDFELSSTIGDPAYDLGLIVGEYLTWGYSAEPSPACNQCVQRLLDTYRKLSNANWDALVPRIMAFAGAAMLKNGSKFYREESSKEIRVELLSQKGKELLAQGLY